MDVTSTVCTDQWAEMMFFVRWSMQNTIAIGTRHSTIRWHQTENSFAICNKSVNINTIPEKAHDVSSGQKWISNERRTHNEKSYSNFNFAFHRTENETRKKRGKCFQVTQLTKRTGHIHLVNLYHIAIVGGQLIDGRLCSERANGINKQKTRETKMWNHEDGYCVPKDRTMMDCQIPINFQHEKIIINISNEMETIVPSVCASVDRSLNFNYTIPTDRVWAYIFCMRNVCYSDPRNCTFFCSHSAFRHCGDSFGPFRPFTHAKRRVRKNTESAEHQCVFAHVTTDPID